MRAFIKSVERRNATHKRHRRSQGGQRVYGLPKFLENIEIVCFERRFSKQNSVIRLKLNILAPSKFFATPPNFWAGYATDKRTVYKPSHPPTQKTQTNRMQKTPKSRRPHVIKMACKVHKRPTSLHCPYPWAPAEIFPEGATSRFCLSFSGC